MRVPKYLSPTSLTLFYKNRDEFYVNYIMDSPPPRMAQTGPMSVGSAFDAYVKSYLVGKLGCMSPEFEFTTIFEAQVEPHNRDDALAAGKLVFDEYQAVGALADLVLDLEGAVGQPRFETRLEGHVSSVDRSLGDINFLGKPDIYFLTKHGARVVFDWKVNGFYSRMRPSPKPGFVRMRPGSTGHKNCMKTVHKGVSISMSHPLDTVDKEWAAQLGIYGWLLGNDVGSSFIVAIDQIVTDSGSTSGKRVFSVAQHRSLITERFQNQLYEKAAQAWKACKSGHIFFEVSEEESRMMCKTIDLRFEVPPDASFESVCR